MSLLSVLTHRIDVSALYQGFLPLTKDRLWQEVVRFSRKPHEFVEHVVSTQITHETAQGSRIRLERTQDFGQFAVNDTIVLTPLHKAIVHVPAQGQIPASMFSITLEEDEQGHLLLIFDYREGELPGVSQNAMLMSIRKNAWKDKDQRVVAHMLEHLNVA